MWFRYGWNESSENSVIFFFMFCFNNRKWMNALIIRTFKNSDKLTLKMGVYSFYCRNCQFLNCNVICNNINLKFIFTNNEVGFKVGVIITFSWISIGKWGRQLLNRLNTYSQCIFVYFLHLMVVVYMYLYNYILV